VRAINIKRIVVFFIRKHVFFKSIKSIIK